MLLAVEQKRTRIAGANDLPGDHLDQVWMFTIQLRTAEFTVLHRARAKTASPAKLAQDPKGLIETRHLSGVLRRGKLFRHANPAISTGVSGMILAPIGADCREPLPHKAF